MYDVIIGDAPLSEVVQQSPEFPGLAGVPATIHLAGAEIELVSMVAREQRLRTALDTYLSHAPAVGDVALSPLAALAGRRSTRTWRATSYCGQKSSRVSRSWNAARGTPTIGETKA